MQILKNSGATGWITMGKWINETNAAVFKGDDKKKMWMPYVKGCVSLSGEAGIGLFGALRSACSIVMDHSVLGRVGLGCMVSNEGEEEIIVPQDGLSMRVYHVPQHWKVEISAGEIQKIRVSDTTIEIQGKCLGLVKVQNSHFCRFRRKVKKQAAVVSDVSRSR